MNAEEALANVASIGLPGVELAPLTVDSFDELLKLARLQRMLPWLSEAVSLGLIDASSRDRERLRDRSLAATGNTLAAHAAATWAVQRLGGRGVTDVRVLKGCATAFLDYAPLGQRFSTDVDLLIRPDDYGSAMAALADGQPPVSRSRRFQWRYGKATTLHDERGVEVDLHTMLTHGYFGLSIPIDELMSHREEFSIGGVQMYALDRPSRLLHAANHVAASAYVGLHSRRDVPQLALADDDCWVESIDRAERWHVDGLFAAGVIKAWNSFRIDRHPLLEWAEQHRADLRQRTALKIMGERAHGPQATGPLALPPHRWPGYVLPFLFPSREFLAARGEDRRSLVTRISRELRER